MLNLNPNVIDSLPLIIEKDELNRITPNIDLVINGKRKRFRLDTGSEESSLKNDNFSTSFKSIALSSPKIGASGVIFHCDTVSVDQVKLGKMYFKNHNFLKCPNSIKSHNYLGRDLLEEFVFQLDYSNEKFNRLKKLPKGPAFGLKKLRSGLFAIPIELASIMGHGIFDTGAEITVVNEKFINHFHNQFKFIKKTNMRDISGTRKEIKVYHANSVIIGGIELKDIEVISVPYNTQLESMLEYNAVIIGNNIIKKFKWSFDLGNEKWTFE